MQERFRVRYVRSGDGAGEVTIDLIFQPIGINPATAVADFEIPPIPSVTWLNGETGIREVSVALVNDTFLDNQDVFETIAAVPVYSGSGITVIESLAVAVVIDLEDLNFDLDTDGDGTPDVFDLDDDADLVFDFLDEFPKDFMPENDLPIQTGIPTFTTTRDVPLIGQIDVPAVSQDPEGNTVFLTLNSATTTSDEQGTFTGREGSLVLQDGNFVYTPAEGFVGTDTVRFFPL